MRRWYDLAVTPVYRVLTGPTAAGKTDWLLTRATHRPQLVISADSRQVYRHMNIGTGKPTPCEQQMLPHRGLDCLEPGMKYSVYKFLRDAAAGLREAREAEHVVWVCGGTGLYIRALVEGLSLGSRPRPQLREALMRRFENLTPREVAAELKLTVTDPDNPVRVVRQAEQACADTERARCIYEWAGLPAQLVHAETGDDQDEGAWHVELARWRCVGIAVLDHGRERLHERISRRVTGMFAAGLVEEVSGLRRLGYGDADVVRGGIGYLEAGRVIDGALSIDDAIERTAIRTRQYAKRQRTYFAGQGWPVFSRDELADWAERS